MDEIIIHFLMHLLGQSPVLLAYLVGMVLALVFYQRCPRPATLALIAMALLLATTLARSFLLTYSLRARDEFGWTNQQHSWMLSATLAATKNMMTMNALAVSFAGWSSP